MTALKKSTLTTNFELSKITETPQISLLKKEIGESSLVIEIVRLIVELSQLVPYRGQGAPFTSWAKMLVSSFGNLRVEELAYIFREGANGKWGRDGKIYGELTYSFITEWINIYDIEESQPHFVNENLKKQGEHKQSMKDWNVDFKPLIEIVDKQLTKDKEIRTEAQPVVTQQDFDRRNYEAFMMFGKTYTDIQLQDALIGAQKNNFTETSNAIQEEINSRK